MNRLGRLLGSLKILGVNPSLETFSERKRNQKLAYLIQEIADVSLGYTFSWYIRGPYSPDLTRDLFGGHTTAPVETLNRDESTRVATLKNQLGDYLDSPDLLEVLVSLHYLRGIGREQKVSKSDVMNALKEKKPFFSDMDVEKAWQWLDALEVY